MTKLAVSVRNILCLLSICAVFPVFLFGQSDSLKNVRIQLLPVVARSIETDWSFGGAASATFRLSRQDTVSRTSNLQALGLYSIRKQLVVALNGAQYFNREKYILNEQFSFSSFPDKFWGLGKHAPDEAEESYDFKQFYTYLHLLRKIGPHLFGGILYEYQRVWDVEYKAGGAFDQQQVAGRKGYVVSGLGLSLTYDNRNHAFSPDKGIFAQAYFNHFDKYLGSDFIYTNIVVDLRKYIAVTKRSVLALQAYSFSNIGDEVPLRSLASFGGPNSMRGYYHGRYRDKQQLFFQAEYRFPLYKRFGGVAFAGSGDVGHSMNDFSFVDMKHSFGAGLRFALNKSEKLNLRLDYGIGHGKNSGLYFQLGEAF